MSRHIESLLAESAVMAMALMTTALLAPAGAGAEEPRPSVAEAQAAGTQEPSAAEPTFTPGIPGLLMVDVRDHKFLWREIEELQVWELGDRISVAEYRSKVIEKTAHYLELDRSAEKEFSSVAVDAIGSIRRSFSERQPTGTETAALDQVSAAVDAAAARVTSTLKDKPRHHLFAPDCKKWLLQLAFGPSEAKEEREAKQTQAASGKPGS